MTTSPTPLPPELVAKATQAIRALPMWGETIYTADHLARVALLAADVPGLLTERDSAVHVAEILAVNLKQEEVECDRLRGSIAVEKRWRKDADEQRDEARAALAVALHIIGDAEKILTDEYGDYGPLAKRVTDVKEHARRVLGGGGRVTNLEKTLESDSDTLRNEIARLLVQTEAQRNAIDGLRAAKAELARQVEDLREELSELADAGIEKVLALEAELATLRKSRNHGIGRETFPVRRNGSVIYIKHLRPQNGIREEAMNAELMEKAMTALYESQGDVTVAIRVAIEACAEICAAEHRRLQELCRTGNMIKAVDAAPRSFQAQTDEYLIRALLTASEAAAPLPDAS